MAVSAQGVCKKFGEFCAVNDVSFTIPQGECTGLLGPNGAGKSTLITMIYGATPRTAGGLKVFNLDPQVSGRDLKRGIGVVTQENALDEAMTVRENMLMFARFFGLPRQKAVQTVDELLNFMNLTHKADAKIKALSGGMQRRLVFVRALIAKPRLVILDEPTTGLDPAVRHLIWQKIQELKKLGTTIILTTHYMDEAEILCDRILIMDQGKICAEGRPRDLIRETCPGFVAVLDHNEVLREPTLESLSAMIHDRDLKPTMIRPANLEDVFLHVTGRELTENA